MYRYLGDDCVMYEPGNSDRHELMAACGEHKPVVISDRAPDGITALLSIDCGKTTRC